MSFHVSQQGNSQRHFVPMDVVCIRHFSGELHELHRRHLDHSLLGRHMLMLVPGGCPLGHELLGNAIGYLFGRNVLAVVDDFGDLIPVGVV